MKPSPLHGLLGTVLWALGTSGCHAADENTFFMGPAAIHFNVESSDLVGPTGTTPAGIKIDVERASTLALVYTRNLSAGFSFSVLGGLPPVLHFKGAGAGAALGEVGTARSWFPALTLDYSPGRLGLLRPFISAGLNRASFTQSRVNASYTAAFGGTASEAKLKSGFGTVLRLGVDVPLSDRLVLQAATVRYRIKTDAEVTTQTPGVGPIVRSLSLRSDPDVFAIVLGYRY